MNNRSGGGGGTTDDGSASGGSNATDGARFAGITITTANPPASIAAIMTPMMILSHHFILDTSLKASILAAAQAADVIRRSLRDCNRIQLSTCAIKHRLMIASNTAMPTTCPAWSRANSHNMIMANITSGKYKAHTARTTYSPISSTNKAYLTVALPPLQW